MGAKPIGTVSALSIGFAVVLATPLAAVAAENANPSQDNQHHRVCRNLTPTGSRLIRRVCRTQAEWERSADEQREGLLKFQRDNASLYQRDFFKPM